MKTKIIVGIIILAAFAMFDWRAAAQTLRYVDLNCATPTPPFTNWTTAATNIQDAIDAANAGDSVFITNGLYQSVAVTKLLLVQSVNGPEFTVITGNGRFACATLTGGAVLSGFTLANGIGGVSGASTTAVVSNCVLTGNSAPGGGGAHNVTLNNCTISGNTAIQGGGVRQSEIIT